MFICLKMANLGLKNILADCIARVLTEQKAQLPGGEVELSHMRFFFSEAKLTPEEREQVLNYVSPKPLTFQESIDRGLLPNQLLSTEAITMIMKANPLDKFLFFREDSDTGESRHSVYIAALLPYFSDRYLKGYSEEELVQRYVDRYGRADRTYEYNHDTKLVEVSDEEAGTAIEQLTLSDIADVAASDYLEHEFPQALAFPGHTLQRIFARTKIQKEIGGPDVEQKLLLEKVIHVSDSLPVQRVLFWYLIFGKTFHQAPRMPGSSKEPNLQFQIPGTIPHADFIKFFENRSQADLQELLTNTGLLEKFYTYLFNQFTLEQLKDYRHSLIERGVDVSECSDAYIRKYNTYLREFLLQQEMGVEALAPEIFGFL